MPDGQRDFIDSRRTTDLPQIDAVLFSPPIRPHNNPFFLHLGGQAAAEFFAEQSQSLSTVLRHSTLVVLLVIGDIAMVYRLWSIWNHSKRVVIIPIILLFVLCALAVLGIYQSTLPDTGIPQNSESGELTVAGAAVWIIVLSTTSFRSVSIFVLKLTGLQFIVIILAESLSSYTTWGSLLVILFCLKSTFYLFFADTQPPIIGIAFVILHVRVGLRRLGRINTMKLDEGQLGQEITESYPGWTTRNRFRPRWYGSDANLYDDSNVQYQGKSGRATTEELEKAGVKVVEAPKLMEESKLTLMTQRPRRTKRCQNIPRGGESYYPSMGMKIGPDTKRDGPMWRLVVTVIILMDRGEPGVIWHQHIPEEVGGPPTKVEPDVCGGIRYAR
ncbi:hypothetical protein BD779DRAFT_1470702 [Infundibulicybe gibba]|nr:hypothetical protein BD779DRAFT_1470702 [Infundibulicybe gibba]